ncbi:hypothetical protein [Nocardia thraciensis]
MDALDFGPFRRARGWCGTDPEALLDQYDDAVARLVTKRLTPYMLRHTGISWRLQGTCSAKALLAHSLLSHNNRRTRSRINIFNYQAPERISNGSITQTVPDVGCQEEGTTSEPFLP